jgi:phosphoribosylformylglycinamidine synthase
MRNSHKRFVNRWVEMNVSRNSPCKFFESLEIISLPMRHGEGRLCLEPKDGNGKQEDFVKAHAPLRYTEDVNGSFDRIAALTNESGTVLGMMPHPEAFMRATHHPQWTERQWQQPSSKRPPDGVVIFQNIRKVLN